MGMTDFAQWKPCPTPDRRRLEGRYVALEPFDRAHVDGLFAASMGADREALHRYLFEPVSDRALFQSWFEAKMAQTDPLYFAVINKANGNVVGRQCFMRIEPQHGVIEIGSILWGAAMARTRLASEALFLFAQHAFSLGYRRFEWKCNNANEPSKRAALRFGFTYEGTFRQHMIVKGKNRDTSWFSMLGSEWPARAAMFEAWLNPDNFDANGQQRRPLNSFFQEK
jgi:RimJ/RimL family protein N-acetyltransferase